jgi:hypothetical protein
MILCEIFWIRFKGGKDGPSKLLYTMQSLPLRDGDWEDLSSSQSRQKVLETPSQPMNQAWWFISVIPAMLET